MNAWNETVEQIHTAARFLKSEFRFPIQWCVILGSGLGGLGQLLEQASAPVKYAAIPGFPGTSVAGHSGELCIGKVNDIGVVVMEGRFHLYEGHSARTVVLPVRVLMKLGVTHFFITNAAGGINPGFQQGDLMLIRDHLNLLGQNPLTGPNLDEFGPRFPAMAGAYPPELITLCENIADNHGIDVQKGVYAALPGPTYETPAEINMLRILGADAVGMSTVPEVIAIRHAGCRVIAMSLITNMTTSSVPPTHQEVVETADKRKKDCHKLILETIRRNV